MINKQLLEELGLSTREAKIYLVLLEVHEARSGELVKKTGISNSHIYEILNTLVSKGLVSYSIQKNTKHYFLTPAASIKTLFAKEEQKKIQELHKLQENTEKITTVLEKIQAAKKSSKASVKYFENISGVQTMWREIMSSMKKGSTIKNHASVLDAYKNIKGFYQEYAEQRITKGVHEKIILPIETTPTKRKNRSIKQAKLTNKAEWGTTGDLFYIQYLVGKEPKSYLFKDKILAQTFGELFDRLWYSIK